MEELPTLNLANGTDVTIDLNEDEATAVLTVYTPTEHITLHLDDADRRALIELLYHEGDEDKALEEFERMFRAAWEATPADE